MKKTILSVIFCVVPIFWNGGNPKSYLGRLFNHFCQKVLINICSWLNCSAIYMKFNEWLSIPKHLFPLSTQYDVTIFSDMCCSLTVVMSLKIRGWPDGWITTRVNRSSWRSVLAVRRLYTTVNASKMLCWWSFVTCNKFWQWRQFRKCLWVQKTVCSVFMVSRSSTSKDFSLNVSS